METCNIVLLIWNLIFFFFYALLFIKILCYFKEKQVFIEYYFEYSENQTNRSSAILLKDKNSSRNLNHNDTILPADLTSIKSLRNEKDYLMLWFLNNYYYLFRLIRTGETSPLVISRLISIYIMIFSYFLISNLTVICFLEDFENYNDCFYFIFMVIFGESFVIFVINIIFVKIYGSFTLNSLLQKKNNDKNFAFLVHFCVFCNIIQCVIFFVAFYFIIEKNFQISTFYFLLLGITLETFFFRVLWSLFILLAYSLKIKCKKKKISEFCLQAKINDLKEKELKKLIWDYINPNIDCFYQEKENLPKNNNQEGKIQKILDEERFRNYFVNEQDLEEEEEDSGNAQINQMNENIIPLQKEHNKKLLVLATLPSNNTNNLNNENLTNLSVFQTEILKETKKSKIKASSNSTPPLFSKNISLSEEIEKKTKQSVEYEKPKGRHPFPENEKKSEDLFFNSTNNNNNNNSLENFSNLLKKSSNEIEKDEFLQKISL